MTYLPPYMICIVHISCNLFLYFSMASNNFPCDVSSFTLTRNSKHHHFIEAKEIKNISELIEVQEKKRVLLLVRLNALQKNEPWYYEACNYCSHKATFHTYRCDKCKGRVHVEQRVQDATGIVSLTLWDRHAKRLLQKLVYEVLAVSKRFAPPKKSRTI